MIVLDVGQGLAVLVQTHAHTMLYDTGPRYTESADAGNRIIAPVLRGIGVPRIDTMVVSHQDSDHSGGVMSLLQTVPVTMLLSSLPADHAIVRAREARHESVERCRAGQRWSWDGVDFELMHPVDASYANPKLKANDLSCVVRVASMHGSALLTGDIEARSEVDLVRRAGVTLHADVLVVPHHGSRTSSTPSFIGAVNPELAIFTPGYRNRFGHPRPEVVQRYAAAGITSHRTDYDGALTIEFAHGLNAGSNEGSTHAARSQRATDARYWRAIPVRAELPALE
jgi:competence protein ComEC